MDEHRWWRTGGGCGIAAFALYVIGFVVRGNAPSYDEPMDVLRRFWEDDGHQYLVGQYIVLLAFVLFFPFVVALSVVLGRAEGEPRMWSRVSLVGGVVFLAVGLDVNASWLTLAFSADHLSDDGINTLMHLDAGAYAIEPLPFGVLLFGASVVIHHTRVFGRWFAYVGFVAAAATALAPLALLDYNPDDLFQLATFLALVAGDFWFLLIGISLVRRREEPVAPRATGPVA
jgi:hypothetical protein